MKLPSLASTTQRPTRDAVERIPRLTRERIRRVESMEGIEGDRQRSVRQELDEVEPAALAPCPGQAEIRREAGSVAAQVRALGAAADDLIKADDLPRAVVPQVDDAA